MSTTNDKAVTVWYFVPPLGPFEQHFYCLRIDWKLGQFSSRNRAYKHANFGMRRCQSGFSKTHGIFMMLIGNLSFRM
ncbi:unnamed protein product [Clavelina lepadiformis]|uniref:Uncharacterized protein n=1 Tax=Clavelina lepadiformis TaxID=159417 RepID=A0ABP0GPC9_CLALP